MAPLWNFMANGHQFQVRAPSLTDAINCIRNTLPQSDVDYTSFKLAPPEQQNG